MKKWTMLGVIIILILLLGCTTTQWHSPTAEQIAQADFGDYPNDYQAKIQQCMSKSLLDPYSAIYEFGKPTKGWINLKGKHDFGYIVQASINAKNNFGGYVGKRPYTFFYNSALEVWVCLTRRVGNKMYNLIVWGLAKEN